MTVAADKPSSDSPRRTPLYDLHRALGARMVGFAGYEMPVQYPMGVLKEHLHTRAAAGLFDVSHMGQIVLRAKRGDVDEAARALERLVPVDVMGLAVGRQRYAFFTNETGGVLDDLMIARFPDSLLLVCNAARKAADEAHLRDALSDCCDIEVLDRALIALQGPSAESALAPLASIVSSMRFMDARETSIMGAKCIVTRSGYTGEDGFEISIPSSNAREIVETFLARPNVAPIGLGARDSLRLEAGLCLYGADLDEATTPVEGGLSWAIQKVRRRGGSRAGGFPGADLILNQLDAGATRRRIGLRPEGRAPVRGGALLFAADDGGEPIGRVTSGGFGPTVDAPIAMGYLPASFSTIGARIYVELRGKREPATIVALPFVKPRYKHG
ncbi:MAG: glycine cleavage system aminomethyltransferase GcvT [Methylocystis sp.]|jgi:aminomethyltransferase